MQQSYGNGRRQCTHHRDLGCRRVVRIDVAGTYEALRQVLQTGEWHAICYPCLHCVQGRTNAAAALGFNPQTPAHACRLTAADWLQCLESVQAVHMSLVPQQQRDCPVLWETP